MTCDPGPDLASEPAPPEPLSDADSRLLEALSRPAAHVVTAAEDDPPASRAGQQEHAAGLLPAASRGPVTPVFQEPTG